MSTWVNTCCAIQRTWIQRALEKPNKIQVQSHKPQYQGKENRDRRTLGTHWSASLGKEILSE